MCLLQVRLLEKLLYIIGHHTEGLLEREGRGNIINTSIRYYGIFELQNTVFREIKVFNRPGVAGAAL